MTQFRKITSLVSVAAGCRWALTFGLVALAIRSGAVEPGRSGGPQVSDLAGLPLCFEANRGQTDAKFQFIARGRGCNFFVAPAEAVLTLTKLNEPSGPREKRGAFSTGGEAQTRSLRFRFLGANKQARVTGLGELPGRANYFLGRDPSQWQTGVPLFTQTRVEQIYPGVNLVYYGNQQRLEYDFNIAAQADPTAISIRVTGPDKIRVDARGDLVLTVGHNEIRQPKPMMYQPIRGVRHEVTGGYRLVDKQTVAFQIGEYDQAHPLVIDPVLSYSTYYGGTGLDIGWAVQLDTNGFIYVAGETMGDLPVAPDTMTNAFGGSTTIHGDAFVAKFSNIATNLIYLSYVGGRDDDIALSLAVDAAGSAYITGYTDSTNFPTAPANFAIFTNLSGTARPGTIIPPLDAFVAKLGPLGTNLVYSTYLGGNGIDEGVGIAIDPVGNAYVTGYTESTNFPTFNTPWTNYLGNGDGFVTKIGPAGTNIVYSTFLGGTNLDSGSDIAADAGGNAYVTGYTSSTNFPILNAVQSSLNNVTNAYAGTVYDAFVTKLTPGEGSPVALGYSTFLGGTNTDYGFRLDLDRATNVYLTGTTYSPDFFRSSTNLYSSVAGATNVPSFDDVFVAKLDANGSRVYSVVFGGDDRDEGWDIAADSFGNAHVVGFTASTNFPTYQTSNFLRATNSGGADVFVAELNRDGTALNYSAYLGGSTNDFGYGIAVDPAGNTYVVGETASTNFPAFGGGQFRFGGGDKDAFLAKIVVETALNIAQSGGDVLVSWPAFSAELTLQSNPDVSGVSNNWVDVPAATVLTNARETVTLGATNDTLYFRLRR